MNITIEKGLLHGRPFLFHDFIITALLPLFALNNGVIYPTNIFF